MNTSMIALETKRVFENQTNIHETWLQFRWIWLTIPKKKDPSSIPLIDCSKFDFILYFEMKNILKQYKSYTTFPSIIKLKPKTGALIKNLK